MDKNIYLQAPVSLLFSDGSSSALNIQTAEANMKLGSTVGINTLELGGNTVNNLTGGYTAPTYRGYYWGWMEPYNNYYHNYYHSYPSPDKFEIAFKLARKLMEKKLVKPMKTVEDFFKLMDSIVETL